MGGLPKIAGKFELWTCLDGLSKIKEITDELLYSSGEQFLSFWGRWEEWEESSQIDALKPDFMIYS